MSDCPICRAEAMPASVAWELGFVAGFKTASSPTGQELRAFLNNVCDHHATHLSRILQNRLRRRTGDVKPR